MRRLARLACASAFTIGASSAAFGKCDGYALDIKSGQARGAANLECATQAEKAGNLSVAMGFYWGVYGDDCADSRNCSAPDARQRGQARQAIVRIGRALGSEAEKRNRLRGGDIFVLEADDRWVVKPDAGAIGLYENSFNYAETDRIVLKLVKSTPANLNLFGRAVAHFREREQLKEPDYRYNPAHLAELQKLAVANAEQALAREEKEFRKQPSFTDTSNLDRSLDELKLAISWHESIRLDKQKVYERGKQRGDSLMTGRPAPRLVRQAVKYYELAGDSGRTKRAHEVANKLGDDAAKDGEIDQAREYFHITGNNRRIQELSALQGERKKKIEKEMHKDKQQQDRFKKEQQQLEKELGL